MKLNRKLLFVAILTVSAVGIIGGFSSTSNLPKINGASLVNPHKVIGPTEMGTVSRVNASWVAIIPFGFSAPNEPKVHFNSSRQWWGERVDGTAELVRLARTQNLKVLMKPHVWLRREWIGDFDLDSEAKWLEWEQQYKNYILTYAKLSDSLGVEMLCIATEYKKAAVKRPEFWRKLIAEIREVYDGPITYAANWDNYDQITWWDAVDHIGVDAYFPLVHGADPSEKEIMEAWESTVDKLESFSKKWDRPILFTEYGYQSANGAVGNHWEVSTAPDQLNMDLQAKAYNCFYETFWNEPWVSGGFFWKWHFSDDAGGINNPHFTPQGKPAEQVIARWYGSPVSK